VVLIRKNQEKVHEKGQAIERENIEDIHDTINIEEGRVIGEGKKKDIGGIRVGDRGRIGIGGGRGGGHDKGMIMTFECITQ